MKTRLEIYTSTVRDGSMKPLTPDSIAAIDGNRTSFLRTHDIDPTHTTVLHVTYDRGGFCEYRSITASQQGDGSMRPSMQPCDALVVTQPGHALFLPLADCIGAVLHDPTMNILMVSHIGRQALEESGGEHSVTHLAEKHGVKPENLTVWLSPAAGAKNYPLYAFDGRSMHDVATEQLTSAGVLPERIETSPIDTTEDQQYFSHSEFLKGHRDSDGRFAIVAVMR